MLTQTKIHLKTKIFDVLRRKYVALTPEEEVRQGFVHFLIEDRHYPKELLANEVELNSGNKKLRCDTVVYDTALKPVMIVEYKAPHIELTQAIFNQILDYNSLLGVTYLVMSNGRTTVCCKVNDGNYEFLKEIPEYSTINTKTQ